MARLDRATSLEMGRLLHHPDVQGLESLWRGVFFLLARAQPDTQLRVCLIDVSRDELAADQDQGRALEDTTLFELLVASSARTLGGIRWSLLVGAYSFGPEPEDLALLARVAGVARAAGAPWISGARPALAGYESFAVPSSRETMETPAGWAELRRQPQARSLGLALPRLLLRLPYGEDTDPCEAFRFEELGDDRDHESYLWGNGALACAAVLAQAFQSSGWTLRTGPHRDIGGLPLHLRDTEEGRSAQPCAESLLTEDQAIRILDRGLMPLLSFKEGDSVRLPRLQSVASPVTALEAWWSHR
jgi:type VI secretion system protein ImpC